MYPHGTDGDIDGPPNSSPQTNNNEKDSHRLIGMLPNSRQDKKTPSAHKQIHIFHEPTITLLEALRRHSEMDSSSARKEKLNVGKLEKRQLRKPRRR